MPESNDNIYIPLPVYTDWVRVNTPVGVTPHDPASDSPRSPIRWTNVKLPKSVLDKFPKTEEDWRAVLFRAGILS